MITYLALKPLEKILGLNRVDVKARPVIAERWDKKLKQWVDDPRALDAVSGFSSDAANFFKISEDEANAWIASQTKPDNNPG